MQYEKEFHYTPGWKITDHLGKPVTRWEIHLSKALKSRKIRHFINVPYGTYIPDFRLPDYRVMIELDGFYHRFKEQRLADQMRDAELERFGYLVLRFNNNEVDEDVNKVIDTMFSKLQEWHKQIAFEHKRKQIGKRKKLKPEEPEIDEKIKNLVLPDRFLK